MKSKLLNRFKTRNVPLYYICMPGNPEENREAVFETCKILTDNGFSPYIHIAQGDTLLYVYCKEEDKEKANKCIEKKGAYLAEEPVDWAMKRLITGRRGLF